jgi:diguanylate cyclase (GGDEF)-like protein
MLEIEPAFSEADEQLFQVLEQAASGYLLLNARQEVLRYSAAYQQLFPWQGLALAVGAPLADVFSAPLQMAETAADKAALAGVRQGHLKLLAGQQRTASLGLPGGRSLLAAASPLAGGRLLITYRDQPAASRGTAELEQLSFLDPLTHLPNRRLLLDRLSQAILQSQRTGWLGALLFLDLEQLRAIRKSLGPVAADQLMRQIGQRLLGGVRASDTVARLGDEDFVVMVSDLAPEQSVAATLVQRIGDKLLQSLEMPYVLGEHTHHVAASIGSTLFGPYSHSATELLRQGEIAMYQLRDRSGSGLCFFDPQLQMEVHQRLRMEADLHQALEQERFEMHYQPQYAPSGEVIGLEALLRWLHPSKGLVPPSMFIAVAEESDIILPLGQWTLQAVCTQLAQWQKAPASPLARLPLSVNISAKQFQQPQFADQVRDALASTGAAPDLLVLELPEALLQKNLPQTELTLRQLKALGIRLALDNFGDGETALSILPQLPMDQLKIAQSLVQRLGPGNASEATVQALIGVADSLGLEVVAEGVETLEQRALLEQYGCQRFQGYLLSQPMAESELQALLARQEASIGA